MTITRFSGFAGLFALLAVTLGCGSTPATGSVSGQVKFNGTDVDGGQIRFSPQTGVPVEGPIKAGRYNIEKVPIGDMKVSITWVKPTGKQRDSYGPGSPKVDITEEVIPPNYNTKTELSFVVAPGPNTKDFELKKGK